MILRVLPLSPNRSLIECNIYGRESRRTKATQIELEYTKKEVESEIKRLELQQNSLLREDNHLHSSKPPQKKQKGVIFIADHWKLNEGELNQILARHVDEERQAGKEIHPGARKQNFTQEGLADDDRK